jgi:plastocyanin
VKVGETLTWSNAEGVDHNVTARRGAHFASQAFGEGKTYRFTPRRAGTVAYVCTLHPGMSGRIVVQR